MLGSTSGEHKPLIVENKLTLAPISYPNIRVDSSDKTGVQDVGRFLILGFVLESHG